MSIVDLHLLKNTYLLHLIKLFIIVFDLLFRIEYILLPFPVTDIVLIIRLVIQHCLSSSALTENAKSNKSFAYFHFLHFIPNTAYPHGQGTAVKYTAC